MCVFACVLGLFWAYFGVPPLDGEREPFGSRRGRQSVPSRRGAEPEGGRLVRGKSPGRLPRGPSPLLWPRPPRPCPRRAAPGWTRSRGGCRSFGVGSREGLTGCGSFLPRTHFPPGEPSPHPPPQSSYPLPKAVQGPGRAPATCCPPLPSPEAPRGASEATQKFSIEIETFPQPGQASSGMRVLSSNWQTQ